MFTFFGLFFVDGGFGGVSKCHLVTHIGYDGEENVRTFWKFEGFYFKYNAVERLLETNRQFIFQRNPLNWPMKFDQKKRSSVKFGKKTHFFSLFFHFYRTTISDWYMSTEGVERIALEKAIPVSFERNDNFVFAFHSTCNIMFMNQFSPSKPAKHINWFI